MPICLDVPLNLTHWTFKASNCFKGYSWIPLQSLAEAWKLGECDATLACAISTSRIVLLGSNRWILIGNFFLFPGFGVGLGRDISCSLCTDIAPGNLGRRWSSLVNTPGPHQGAALTGDRTRVVKSEQAEIQISISPTALSYPQRCSFDHRRIMCFDA